MAACSATGERQRGPRSRQGSGRRPAAPRRLPGGRASRSHRRCPATAPGPIGGGRRRSHPPEAGAGDLPRRELPAVLGAGAVHGAGGRPGSRTAALRAGRGEGGAGSLSLSSRGTWRQRLGGGRRQRRCMPPAGGGVPERSGAGAEGSDEKLREEGARVLSPLLGPRRRGSAAPRQVQQSPGEGRGQAGPALPAPQRRGSGGRRASGRAGRSRAAPAPARLKGRSGERSCEQRLAPVFGSFYQRQRRGETALTGER